MAKQTKAKAKSSNSSRDVAQKVLGYGAVVYGLYWAVVGITGLSGRPGVNVLGGILLAVVVVCGAAVGLLSTYKK